MRQLFAVLGLILSLAVPAAAQSVDDVNTRIDMVLGDHTKYEAAFQALQKAVADGDADAVAALAVYPLIVDLGERREIKDEAEFVANYDSIMTEEIKTAISSATYETLFVNDQGVMFGNGEVWLNGVCQTDACEDFDVKIITIQSTDG